MSNMNKTKKEFNYIATWEDIEINKKVDDWAWYCWKCKEQKEKGEVLWGYSEKGSLSEDNPLCVVTGLCIDCYDNGEFTTCIKLD